MNKEQKAQVIAELKESITKCSSGILTDYKGLSNAELTLLRRKLREIGIEYRVVKNTLARFAAENAGKEFIGKYIQGPVAIAFGYNDVTEPARVLMGYIRSSESILSIKGGFLGDQLLNQDDVKNLASIPSREILLAQIIAGIRNPIAGLVNCLAHPLRDFNILLQSRIKQLEDK
ncbi:MAG: 50S ribosomal protein L10 [Dehalococcoidia bacterium]|nr:MAG: 50S ribosomal protein L10 [Dehalococcoidia bacterium]